MELGQYQLQVFISLVVILGAACVALICDFLKGNNEQLRELNIELKVRREEEQRRIKLASRLPKPPAQLPAPDEEFKRPMAPEALAAIERGVQKAAASVEEPSVNATKTGRNWGSVLEAGRRARGSASIPELPPGLPAGFQEGYVLSRLVEAQRPISGLVVSIGVNTPREADGSLPPQVQQLMRSLLGPDDFAVQSSEDEFLLIFPHERGAHARRLLNRISQLLWDFQLRSLGTYSILFSWGGVEVDSESIEEAIASASERMHETKRGRTVLSIGEARRAV
jgi:hypothetical protein